MAWRKIKWDACQAALKKLTSAAGGVERKATPWPDRAVTSVIEATACWPVVWKAVRRHQSRMAVHRGLEHLSEEHHRSLWGVREFHRVFSLASGGRRCESELLEGLR